MKYLSTILVLLQSFLSFGQNNSVGIGTLAPDGSAVLHLESQDQGFLMTTLDSASISSIISPADGLLVYNTQDNCYWSRQIGQWKRLCETDSLSSVFVSNLMGDTLVFNTGYFDSIFATYGNINYLYGDTLIYDYGSFDTIIANYGNITYLEGDTLLFSFAQFDSLYIGGNNITNVITDSISSLAWLLNGNSSTDSTVNYLGTNDAQALVIKTNGMHRITSTSDGAFWVNGGDPGMFGSPIGATPTSGTGIRMMFVPEKWAFRAGRIGAAPPPNDEWDHTNIGDGSVGFGFNTEARGEGAFVWGRSNTANENYSIAGGQSSVAGGLYSSAFGLNNTASGDGAIAWGLNITAGGESDIGIGQNIATTASGNFNVAIGSDLDIDDTGKSVAIGSLNTINSPGAGGSFHLLLGDQNLTAGNKWNTMIGYDQNILNTNASEVTLIGQSNDLLASGFPATGLRIIGADNNVTPGDGVHGAIIGDLCDVNGANLTYIQGFNIDVNSATSGVAIGQNVTIPDMNEAVVISTASTIGDPIGTGAAGGRFRVVAGAGTRIYSNNNIAANVGVTLNGGSGTWLSLSDRNSKTNVDSVDYADVLGVYQNLDVMKWSYIGQTVNGQQVFADGSRLYDNDVYHVGVMAQDYYDAFGLGTDEEHIAVLDVAGTNMAAIKALINENNDIRGEVALLRKEIASLKDIIIQSTKP